MHSNHLVIFLPPFSNFLLYLMISQLKCYQIGLGFYNSLSVDVGQGLDKIVVVMGVKFLSTEKLRDRSEYSRTLIDCDGISNSLKKGQ